MTPTVATPPPDMPCGGAGSTASATGARSGRGCKAAASAATAAKSCASAGEARAGGYQGRFCGRLYLKVRNRVLFRAPSQ